MAQRERTRREPVWFHALESLLSWLVFFEVFYYVTHDGESTLHEAAREKFEEGKDAVREKLDAVKALKRTHKEIQDLPETETE